MISLKKIKFFRRTFYFFVCFLHWQKLMGGLYSFQTHLVGDLLAMKKLDYPVFSDIYRSFTCDHWLSHYNCSLLNKDFGISSSELIMLSKHDILCSLGEKYFYNTFILFSFSVTSKHPELCKIYGHKKMANY